MHHCVGGYASECATGRTQIFSLRTARGIRLSTLQLFAREIRPGLFHFTQKQNRAACNASPTFEADTAAKQLISALNKGEVRHSVGDPLLHRSRMALHLLCGFDYRNDTAWEQARAGALPFLPSDVRRLGAMELGEMVTDFRLKKRCEQPELDEPDDEHEDFEKRVLRWIR